MWPHTHPLAQLTLSSEVMHNVEKWANDAEPQALIAMTNADVGKLIHGNERQGAMVRTAAQQLPHLTVSATVQPLGPDLLRVRVKLVRDFVWSDKVHGRFEPFYAWVSDENDLNMFSFARVLVTPAQPFVVRDFFVPVGAALPATLHVHSASERWLGCDEMIDVALEGVVLPRSPPTPLRVLDLPLFELDGGGDEEMADVFITSQPVLDPAQTQAFHTLCYTRANSLVCMPDDSARLVLLAMTVWCV